MSRRQTVVQIELHTLFWTENGITDHYLWNIQFHCVR